MVRSPIRYPGGKSKHVDKILLYLCAQENEYREPFVGGASVYLAGNFPGAWINDIDPEVYDLWMLVKHQPGSLISWIRKHTSILDHKGDKDRIKAAIELWHDVKEDSAHNKYPPGYRLLFLSKTCFSGVVTGGPTGGMSQNGEYNLLSRWAQNQTIRLIRDAHEKIKDCTITNGDWADLVDKPGDDVVLYLDPPYLEKGKQCYRCPFTLEDHKNLAERLLSCSHRWVVTLDDVPQIREIWTNLDVPEHRIIPTSLMYTMDGKRKSNREGKELFIMDERSYSIAQKKRGLWN